ncbi:MAG: hypothetical protein KKH98_00345 [Spirochaetes bacterium]|nr:hypothetical protein [Spirochaetota bacterium]
MVYIKIKMPKKKTKEEKRPDMLAITVRGKFVNFKTTLGKKTFITPFVNFKKLVTGRRTWIYCQKVTKRNGKMVIHDSPKYNKKLI